MTIYEQFIATFNSGDRESMSIAEIADRMARAHATSHRSVLPSDFCYNMWNLPLRERKFLFERVENGRYRYLGPNYPYTGSITRRARGTSTDEVVGEWRNGVRSMFRSELELAELEGSIDVADGRQVWFTTHWPQREDTDAPQNGVYVQDGKEHVLRGMKVGDLVWIYESDSGKTALRTAPDGTTHPNRCKQGRQGVVALCQVIVEPASLSDQPPETYTDGTSKWWRWNAATKVLNSAGFVSRVNAAECLDFKPNYVFRGFGDGSSGIKKITSAQHEALLQRFCDQSIDDGDALLLQAAEKAVRRRGGGGEGELHRRIKETIAANPAESLGEVGLICVRVEYPYETGDRVDVLLRDRFGRYVAVEVEPTCDANEICGPLQCMKYRAMLAYLRRVPTSEVRAILVAPSVHPEVRSRCEQFDVEVVEFSV